MALLTRKTRYETMVQHESESNRAFFPERPDDMVSGLEEGAFKKHSWTSGETKRAGFCRLDSLHEVSFEDVNMWSDHGYAAFGLRIDSRKVPGRLIKSEMDKVIKAWKLEHDVKSVPHVVRSELRQQIMEDLFSRATPVPKMVEIAVDFRRQRVLISGASKNDLDDVRRMLARHLNMWTTRSCVVDEMKDTWTKASPTTVFSHIVRKSIEDGLNVDIDGIGNLKVVLGTRVQLMDAQGQDITLVISGESNARDCADALDKKMSPVQARFIFAVDGDEMFFHVIAQTDDMNLHEVETPPSGGETLMEQITVKMMLLERAETLWRAAIEKAVDQVQDTLLEGAIA
jgi:hypothetical protein